MRFLSICSGVEAASLAFCPLGWQAAGYSEIDPAACHVLHHRFGCGRPMFMPDPDAPGLSTKERAARWRAIHNVSDLPVERTGAPNFGDMTRFQEWPDVRLDAVVGGTPCQSFSIAGLRNGLADPRGNLALVFLAIIDRYRPEWVVWENVPGVFSATSHDAPDLCPPDIDLEGDNAPEDGTEIVVADSYEADETHAFSCFLAGFSELGYGFAYRTPDAQHFGVPQRRNRVVLVGRAGDWAGPAAVLFERHSLSRHSAPSRETRAGATVGAVAGTSPGGGWRVGADEALAGQLVADTVATLDASYGRLQGASGQDANHGHSHLIAAPLARCDTAGEGKRQDWETTTIIAHAVRPPSNGAVWRGDGCDNLVAHTLRGEGFDASEDGTGRGTPLVAVEHPPVIAFHGSQDPDVSGNISHPVGRNQGQETCIAWSIMPQNSGKDYKARAVDVAQPVMAGGPVGGNQGGDYIQTGMQVRRLTPRECERLQGMPDDWTLVPWRGGMMPDGPRYKMIGNSWPVPVFRWVGERIDMVRQVLREAAE